MRLEIKTGGIEFVVSREPLANNGGEGRQKANRDTGELLLLFVTEVVDDGGAVVVKVPTTAGAPKASKRQAGAGGWPGREPGEHRRPRSDRVPHLGDHPAGRGQCADGCCGCESEGVMGARVLRLVSAQPADTRELQAAFERAEWGRVEAAEAEQAAYQRWQDAYAAYEIARDDAWAAWTAWAECTGG